MLSGAGGFMQLFGIKQKSWEFKKIMHRYPLIGIGKKRCLSDPGKVEEMKFPDKYYSDTKETFTAIGLITRGSPGQVFLISRANLSL